MDYDDMMSHREDAYIEKMSDYREAMKLARNGDAMAIDAALYFIDEHCGKDGRIKTAMEIGSEMSPELAAEFMSRVLDVRPSILTTNAIPAPFSVKAYGRTVGEHKRAMVKLGLEMARETALGRRKPEDARDVLTEFSIEASVASGKFERPSRPSNVQVSKLSRFFLVGEMFGLDAVDMIERASDVYINSINRNPKFRGKDIESGEFNSIARVMRRSLTWKRILTNTEIFSVMIGEH